MLNFTFAYQPILDTVTGQAASYEALVRGLANETAGTVFSRVAPGGLHDFDTAARRRALMTAVRLGIACDLNLNLLPGSLERADVELRRTITAARLHGFPLTRLIVEISESEVITDPARLREQLAAFRALGGRVAIDDFGAGHSGLSLLADFQPDMVKLDRHLCHQIDLDPRRQAIVRALLRCCRELGCEVVAEGIERVEELSWAMAEGVSLFQGFLFGQPGFERLLPVSKAPVLAGADHALPWLAEPHRHQALA